MDKFFSLLGKILVVIGIAGVLIGGGYYLGTHFNKTTTPIVKPVTSVSPTQIVTPTSTAAAAIVSPTSTTPTGRFAVTAGGLKPFFAYTLSGIAGWTPTKTTNASIDKLILSQGEYSVTILQGAIGGGGCTFPGDTPQEMSVTLTTSTMIPLLSGNPLRRGQAPSDNPSGITFTVCQKTADGHYGSLTDFGAINYTTPFNPSSQMLAEMDAMVGSLQKQ